METKILQIECYLNSIFITSGKGKRQSLYGFDSQEELDDLKKKHAEANAKLKALNDEMKKVRSEFFDSIKKHTYKRPKR